MDKRRAILNTTKPDIELSTRIVNKRRKEKNAADEATDRDTEQKKYFLHMLDSCGIMKQVAALRNVEPTVLPIEWTTATNKVDSGVYLMRHMETFMGQKVNEWKCGLTPRSALSLQYLRAKMSKELLFGNSNAVMYKIRHLSQ
ncbi:hypothetical protein SASPL_133150 [Salvia splendens]|uniref:Uncharacterized protein n=1 Tax=Salvia splendens TaxID=180675 RepID=A0A8X8X4D0_SALSN|nr:hypothetical protein SASPL_133150 [Salvia splendens]